MTQCGSRQLFLRVTRSVLGLNHDEEIKMTVNKLIKSWAVALCLMIFGVLVCHAAEPASAPVKVAILPFNMHTPPQLIYLQDGIRDMLTSRLGWEGKVQVLDRTTIDQATRGIKSDLSMDDALRIGRSLKADYVVFGSLTGIGQAISIDAKMASLSGKGEPLNFSSQTKTMDEVVPQINLFAQEINQKVFARPGEKVQTAAAEEESASTRNPELLIPSTMLPGEKISYLNPNFVEVTPDGSLRQPGLWRSQNINAGIVGMDVGDLNGDGRMEVVGVTKNKVIVYRKEGQALRPLGTYSGASVDHFLSVTVLDIDRDGRAEIFVSNLRQGVGRPRPDEIQQNEPGYGREMVASLVLRFIDPKFEVVSEKVPYFLNGVEFPKRERVLLGQQKGGSSEGAFQSEIYEMQLRGGTLSPLVRVNLPGRCNVFNFARADINNDGAEETILIDNSNRLLILNAIGDQMWKSDRAFGSTSNVFEGKVTDLRFNDVDYYAIPSPILVTDLNGDGIPEIVVTRAPSTVNLFLPQGLKFYDKGEIISLSWDQMGLIENWKTREVNGMITSIRIADLNKDGNKQLVASLVLAKDYTKIWESKSSLFSYDLNISPAKTTPKKQ
jgi:TolB-like protein